MKAKLQKVRLAGLKKHYKILMQELHRRGIMHIAEVPADVEKTQEFDEHFGVFDLARLDFVIQFLTPYASSKSKIDRILSGGKLILPEEEAKIRLKEFAPRSEGLIRECEEAEEFFVRTGNELSKITLHLKLLENIKNFSGFLAQDFSTEKTDTWIGSVPNFQESGFLEAVSGVSNLVDIQWLSKNDTRAFFRITMIKNLKNEIQEILQKFQFVEIDFSVDFQEYFGQNPKTVVETLEGKKADLETEIKKRKERLRNIAEYLDEFKILSDYNQWRKRKNDVQKEIFYSQRVFAFEGWIPIEEYEILEKWIKNAFVGEVSLEKTKKREGEETPILMKNNKLVRPFEAIVDMFGLPKSEEFDPTPFMAPFFLVFFGTCLSDVGYGSILALSAGFFLLFGRFSSAAKDGLRLLFFAGIFAIIGGVLLGSYFGLDPTRDPVPDFLLRQNWQNLDAPFHGQLLNPMSGSGPLTFMIVAAVLGVIQLLVGVLVDFAQKIANKKYSDAIFDSLAWFLTLSSAILWIGAQVAGVLNPKFALYILIGAAVFLILGQGRGMITGAFKKAKGLLGVILFPFRLFIGAPFVGLFRLLAGIPGYLSDTLSYARLMALGLATGVVGGAMNLTASVLGNMMPHISIKILIMIIVLLAGHALNFALSLLGAFVHSGRLQFIEFFGKFYEGGGKKFEPFVRQKKYLFFDQ